MQTPDTTTLLETLDITSLPPDEQEALLVEIQELITQGVMARVVEGMNDETRNAFEALLAGDADESAITTFLEQQVPNMDTIVAEIVAELQDDILSATGTNA